MSTLMHNGKVLETRGNHNKGWIIEILEDGTEKETGYEYSCYEEAEDALISLAFSGRETSQ